MGRGAGRRQPPRTAALPPPPFRAPRRLPGPPALLRDGAGPRASRAGDGGAVAVPGALYQPAPGAVMKGRTGAAGMAPAPRPAPGEAARAALLCLA